MYYFNTCYTKKKSCGIFLHFLRTVWFLMKICTYILDNTLMVVRIKTLWRVLNFAWCYFEFYSFWRGKRQMFNIFLYFLKKFWYVSWNFSKIFLVLLWQSHTQKKNDMLPYFGRLFWIMLGHIFAHYTVLLVLKNPKYSPNVLHRFFGHQGKK